MLIEQIVTPVSFFPLSILFVNMNSPKFAQFCRLLDEVVDAREHTSMTKESLSPSLRLSRPSFPLF